MPDILSPEQIVAINALIAKALTPPVPEPVPTCTVCRLGPVDRPDEQGRHPQCGKHIDEQLVVMPCTRGVGLDMRCGSAVSVRRDTNPAEVICSWHRREDNLRKVEKLRPTGPDAA